MSDTIEFFDMAVSVTPSGGHMEPVPITLGTDWGPNDIRVLFAACGGKASSGETLPIPMTPNPPTGYTAAYSYDPAGETQGVWYQRLAASATDTSIASPKPPDWLYYMFSTLTVRGADPTTAPVAGKLGITSTAGSGIATIGSVAVPAAGTMVLALGTVADPFGSYLAWAAAVGVPTGWTPLVATAKSGADYYSYDTSPALILVGKSYSSSGSTGAVQFPIAQGSPAFFGMYAFFRPASDVSVAVGAA